MHLDSMLDAASVAPLTSSPPVCMGCLCGECRVCKGGCLVRRVLLYHVQHKSPLAYVHIPFRQVVHDPVPDDLAAVVVSPELWSEVGSDTRKSVKGMLRKFHIPAEGTSSTLLQVCRKLLGRLESKLALQTLGDVKFLHEAQKLVRSVSNLVEISEAVPYAAQASPAEVDDVVPSCLQSSVLDQVRSRKPSDDISFLITFPR